MASPSLKQTVLDAALAVFTEHGYEKATIADIRAHAGVSNGAVFHHFKSKEAIAEALYVDGIASFQAGLAAIIDSRPESVEVAIRQAVTHHLTWNETHRDLAYFMYNRGRPDWAPGHDERIGQLNRDSAARIRAWLDPFIARGEIRDVSTTVLAACVVGPAHFVAHRWLAGLIKAPPTAFAAELGDAACAALLRPSMQNSDAAEAAPMPRQDPMTELVRYEASGPIARITMDDGKVNVMSAAMLTALHAAFDRAERERAIVVLTGRAQTFSAGFDLKVFAARDPQAIYDMMRLGASLALRLLSFPTPVIAACNGHALPMGAFLMLASDIRIGAEGPFRIGLNEVAIGLTVPSFALELARQRLTPAHLSLTAVTGRLFSPAEALAAGFLDQLVPAEDLDATAEAAAQSLTKVDLASHAATKRRLRAGAIAAVRNAIEAEITLDAYRERLAATRAA
jgi:enoyl-CoA hydratase